jgi:hypothetical protein
MPIFFTGLRDTSMIHSLAEGGAGSLIAEVAALDAPTDSIVATGPNQAPFASEVTAAHGGQPNADLLVSLPQGALDAFLPELQPVAPATPLLSHSDVNAALAARAWRDTLRVGEQFGGELIRHESAMKRALVGVHDGRSEVATSPAAIAHDLAQRARQAGLSDDEAKWLDGRLRGSRDGINPYFEADVALVKSLLETENAADALRAFLQMTTWRGTDLDRTTPEILRALTLGVGNARTDASEGQEGILSIEAARAAQRALVYMSPADYVEISQALALAGSSTPAGASQADAQTERALILKAVAAREESLRQGGEAGPYLPSGVCLQITQFATLIRGVDSQALIERTSGIDLDGDGVDEALQQRWQNASAPAVLQMARAEADPIYAWTLHQHALGETTPVSIIGYEQRDLLDRAGGQALQRGGEPGSGADMVIASMASADATHSGVAYERKTVSFAAREAAVNDIAQKVASGRDVPIAVGSMTGQRSALLITDVRGSGSSREFLVTDPWSGRTEWMSCSDFIDGNIGGNGGILSDYWL